MFSNTAISNLPPPLPNSQISKGCSKSVNMYPREQWQHSVAHIHDICVVSTPPAKHVSATHRKACHQVVVCNRKDYQPLGKAQVPHQHQPLTQTNTPLRINGQGAPDSVSTIRLGLSVCLNVAQIGCMNNKNPQWRIGSGTCNAFITFSHPNNGATHCKTP